MQGSGGVRVVTRRRARVRVGLGIRGVVDGVVEAFLESIAPANAGHVSGKSIQTGYPSRVHAVNTNNNIIASGDH